MDLARLQVSFLRFLLYRVWDPHITTAFDLFPRDLALALAATRSPLLLTRANAAVKHATPPQRSPQPSSLRRSRKPPRLPCPRSPGPLATAPPKSPLPSLTTRLSRVCDARIKTEGFSRPLIQPLPYLLDW